jgi:flagellum-specific ATP synthase
MNNVADAKHIESARRFRQLWSRYSKARDLIQLGAYAPGGDHELDAAVRLHPAMVNMLEQNMHTPANLGDSVTQLHGIVGA